MTYAAVEEAAQRAGLMVMGALQPRQLYEPEAQAGTTLLLGTGAEFWPVFTGAPEYLDAAADPVDRWSKRVISAMSRTFGASCSFPSDGPPYPAFIDWALKSGRFHTSPVGMMVHDRVGLMISLRGALHFDAELPIPPATQPSPCNGCAAPCASACPVAALSAATPYDVEACHRFLDSPGGQSCMMTGCAARRACPLSRGAGRPAEQSALHMRSFHTPCPRH